MPRHTAVLMFLAALAAPASAGAPKNSGPLSLTYTSLTVIRINPLGLQELFDAGLQYRLSDSDSLLLKDTFAGLYFSALLTPAFLNPGVSIKVQPLAIIRLEARWSYMSYLGNFDLLQSYLDPSANHSDSDIKAGGDAGLDYSTSGWNLGLTLELRGKLGPVAARSRLTSVYHSMDLKDQDRVWYDPYNDLLLSKSGWSVINDLDILYQLPLDEKTGSMFMAGVRWSLATPVYGAEDFASGTSQDHANGPYHRAGPMFVYTFYDEPGSGFNKPSLIAIVNWHLKHRWRTGADTSQALPYMVLAFAFTGDLWRSGN